MREDSCDRVEVGVVAAVGHAVVQQFHRGKSHAGHQSIGLDFGYQRAGGIHLHMRQGDDGGQVSAFGVDGETLQTVGGFREERGMDPHQDEVVPQRAVVHPKVEAHEPAPAFLVMINLVLGSPPVGLGPASAARTRPHPRGSLFPPPTSAASCGRRDLLRSGDSAPGAAAGAAGFQIVVVLERLLGSELRPAQNGGCRRVDRDPEAERTGKFSNICRSRFWLAPKVIPGRPDPPVVQCFPGGKKVQLPPDFYGLRCEGTHPFV